MMRVIDMASGEDETEPSKATVEVGDLEVAVTSEECRQWSDSISEQLEEFKETKSDAQYRAAFMCAFLLYRFADEMDAGALSVDPDKPELN
jgi:hypothetical protein